MAVRRAMARLTLNLTDSCACLWTRQPARRAESRVSVTLAWMRRGALEPVGCVSALDHLHLLLGAAAAVDVLRTATGMRDKTELRREDDIIATIFDGLAEMLR
jgi:hypothetical protein